MSFKEDVLRTWQDQSRELGVCNAAMGLAGEAGEVVDLLKKHVHHGHDLDRVKLLKEIGDVLYYVEVICAQFQMTREEAEGAVIAKLRLRYPEGFSVEKSVNREEKV